MDQQHQTNLDRILSRRRQRNAATPVEQVSGVSEATMILKRRNSKQSLLSESQPECSNPRVGHCGQEAADHPQSPHDPHLAPHEYLAQQFSTAPPSSTVHGRESSTTPQPHEQLGSMSLTSNPQQQPPHQEQSHHHQQSHQYGQFPQHQQPAQQTQEQQQPSSHHFTQANTHNMAQLNARTTQITIPYHVNPVDPKIHNVITWASQVEVDDVATEHSTIHTQSSSVATSVEQTMDWFGRDQVATDLNAQEFAKMGDESRASPPFFPAPPGFLGQPPGSTASEQQRQHRHSTYPIEPPQHSQDNPVEHSEHTQVPRQNRAASRRSPPPQPTETAQHSHWNQQTQPHRPTTPITHQEETQHISSFQPPQSSKVGHDHPHHQQFDLEQIDIDTQPQEHQRQYPYPRHAEQHHNQQHDTTRAPSRQDSTSPVPPHLQHQNHQSYQQPRSQQSSPSYYIQPQQLGIPEPINNIHSNNTQPEDTHAHHLQPHNAHDSHQHVANGYPQPPGVATTDNAQHFRHSHNSYAEPHNSAPTDAAAHTTHVANNERHAYNNGNEFAHENNMWQMYSAHQHQEEQTYPPDISYQPPNEPYYHTNQEQITSIAHDNQYPDNNSHPPTHHPPNDNRPAHHHTSHDDHKQTNKHFSAANTKLYIEAHSNNVHTVDTSVQHDRLNDTSSVHAQHQPQASSNNNGRRYSTPTPPLVQQQHNRANKNDMQLAPYQPPTPDQESPKAPTHWPPVPQHRMQMIANYRQPQYFTPQKNPVHQHPQHPTPREQHNTPQPSSQQTQGRHGRYTPADTRDDDTQSILTTNTNWKMDKNRLGRFVWAPKIMASPQRPDLVKHAAVNTQDTVPQKLHYCDAPSESDYSLIATESADFSCNTNSDLPERDRLILEKWETTDAKLWYNYQFSMAGSIYDVKKKGAVVRGGIDNDKRHGSPSPYDGTMSEPTIPRIGYHQYDGTSNSGKSDHLFASHYDETRSGSPRPQQSYTPPPPQKKKRSPKRSPHFVDSDGNNSKYEVALIAHRTQPRSNSQMDNHQQQWNHGDGMYDNNTHNADIQFSFANPYAQQTEVQYSHMTPQRYPTPTLTAGVNPQYGRISPPGSSSCSSVSGNTNVLLHQQLPHHHNDVHSDVTCSIRHTPTPATSYGQPGDINRHPHSTVNTDAYSAVTDQGAAPKPPYKYIDILTYLKNGAFFESTAVGKKSTKKPVQIFFKIEKERKASNFKLLWARPNKQFNHHIALYSITHIAYQQTGDKYAIDLCSADKKVNMMTHLQDKWFAWVNGLAQLCAEAHISGSPPLLSVSM